MNAHVKPDQAGALAPNKADIIDQSLCSVPAGIRDSIPDAWIEIAYSDPRRVTSIGTSSRYCEC